MVPIGGIYIPTSQPLYPDMELADTVSVSENKCKQLQTYHSIYFKHLAE